MFRMIDLLNEAPVVFLYDAQLVFALAAEASAYDGSDTLSIAELVVDVMLDDLFAFIPELVVPGDVFVALVDELARVLEVASNAR